MKRLRLPAKVHQTMMRLTLPQSTTIRLLNMPIWRRSLADEQDKYLRLAAEYDNYRKRTAKEKAETYQNASAKCIEELLPVIDSFERSLEAECADGNFKNGMQMIFNQISGFLDKMNVKAIEALGEEFDPNFHNAIQQLDGTDYASNHVCQVFQKGYMLGDKLIRPAMVAVAL